MIIDFGADHHGRVGDVDGAEDVGLHALGPILLDNRHVLQRGGMEDEVGLELGEHAVDAVTVADIGDAAGNGTFARLGVERFDDGMERRFGILQHQQARGAIANDAMADLGADRTATAGDDDGLAGDRPRRQMLIDGDARPKQEVFDVDWGEADRFAGIERRQAAGADTKPPGLHQRLFGLCLGAQGRRHEDDAADANAAGLEIGNGAFDLIGRADDLDAAQNLAAIAG